MAKILVVEDDPDVRIAVAEALRLDRYVVELAEDGEQASLLLRLNAYDLIILDLNLPKASGLDLCTEFRAKGGDTPIIMLTGKRALNDKLTGFAGGADDYLTKPFELEELVARITALLRRSSGQASDTALVHGPLRLEPANYRVVLNGSEIKLKLKEFRILELLMRYPSKVFSLEAIINRIWESSEDSTEDAVRTHIKNLRKRLGQEQIIETFHGVGYRIGQFN